jgi:hypothetical protein
MTALPPELRAALRELAERLSGQPAVQTTPARDDRWAAVYHAHRTELLHGAALLTGAGDTAQDAVHIAAGRLYWTRHAAPVTLTALRAAVLEQARATTRPF